MKLPKVTARRLIVFGLLGVAAAGAAAPFIHADAFRQGIKQALETSLGRSVDIEEVRFSLFQGPGFSVRKVVIHEEPAAGIEPFAYVDSIEARVRLRSFWTGRMEFSSLRFASPSVNLVKTSAGPWNFQPLLSRAIAAELPEIHVRGGRLNFKFGDVKSVFYFTATDLDLDPPSTAGDAFDIGFSGEPARTDRAAHGFGRLSGQGRWVSSRNGEGRMQLDLSLEKSAIGELVTLIHGQDVGVHGSLAARVQVKGPISNLEITGGLELEDIHRWDLMPPYAEGGPLRYHGRLDLLSQRLELETVSAKNSALSVRFQASNYLSQPRWAVSLALNQLPLRPLVEIAPHMGIPIPPPVEMEGRLDGAIDYSPDGGFQGQISLRDALARIPGSPAVQFQEAQLVLDGRRARLTSAVVRTGKGETAQVEAVYLSDARSLDLKISTHGLSVGEFRSPAGPLLGMVRPSFLETFQGGAWDGWLRYKTEGGTPGEW